MNRDTLISVILLAVIGIVVFIFNELTPLAADDYAYACITNSNGKHVASIADIVISQYRHYFSVNGRTTVHFLAQVFLLLGKPAFSVINTLSFLAIGLVIYYHAFLSVAKLKPLPLVFVYFSLFMFTPDFGESFLWVTGSSNYLYGPLLVLLFLIPYRKAFDESSGQIRLCIVHQKTGTALLSAAGMFLLGLAAGNSNENNGVVAVIAAWGFVLAVVIRHKKIAAWHVTAAFGALFGCLLMLLSPGSHSRVGESGFRLAQLPIRARDMTFDVLERFGVLFCIFTLLFSVLFFYYKKTKQQSLRTTLAKLALPLLYLLLFAMSFYALAVPPWFAYRAWTTFMVFLLIAILCAYAIFEREFSSENMAAKRVSACVIFVLLLGVACNNLTDLRVVHTQYENRISIIEQAKENGQSELSLPAISSSNRFSCFGPEGDLLPEDTAWQNHVMASYYGFEKIFAVDR